MCFKISCNIGGSHNQFSVPKVATFVSPLFLMGHVFFLAKLRSQKNVAYACWCKYALSPSMGWCSDKVIFIEREAHISHIVIDADK
jgi:hypothetical protein